MNTDLAVKAALTRCRENDDLEARGQKWDEFLPEEHRTSFVHRCIGMYEACVEMAPTFRFYFIEPRNMFAWFAEHGGEVYGAGLTWTPSLRDFGTLILQAYESLKRVVYGTCPACNGSCSLDEGICPECSGMGHRQPLAA